MKQQAACEYPRVRIVNVSADEAGQRIDNFLSRHLKGVPKSHIYRILRRGEVRVNSGRIRAHYKVRTGDAVRIPPVRVRPPDQRPVRATHDLESCIVFENRRCLVVDKPSGLAVHGGSGVSHGVIEALRALRPTAPYLELAHRLDRDTSGCLVIAKRRSFLRAFHAQQRAGSIGKYYFSLVHGDWGEGSRLVEAPLRKNTLAGGERIVRVSADGKPSATLFRPVERYGAATLLEAELKTGRTHQIRVHAVHAGHPLAGDTKYGDRAFNAEMRAIGLRRLFLHAHRMVFFDDEQAAALDVSAALPADIRTVLDRLESPA